MIRGVAEPAEVCWLVGRAATTGVPPALVFVVEVLVEDEVAGVAALMWRCAWCRRA
jgi:hypothetical protein